MKIARLCSDAPSNPVAAAQRNSWPASDERGLRGVEHRCPRTAGARRAGGDQRSDREMPRLPAVDQRRGADRRRARAGDALRRRDRPDPVLPSCHGWKRPTEPPTRSTRRQEGNGGEGNRTPNSAVQRPRVPISTTPPAGAQRVDRPLRRHEPPAGPRRYAAATGVGRTRAATAAAVAALMSTVSSTSGA